MSTRWYYKLMDKEIGPVPVEELAALAQRREIQNNTPISMNPNGPWMSAEYLNGLFANIEDATLSRIRFNCSNCDIELRASFSVMGQVFTCPYCNSKLVVPICGNRDEYSIHPLDHTTHASSLKEHIDLLKQWMQCSNIDGYILTNVFIVFVLLSFLIFILIAGPHNAYDILCLLFIILFFIYGACKRFEANEQKKLIETLAASSSISEEESYALSISDIDNMTGMAFERYVCRLLISQGFSTSLTNASNDFGVDILATRGREKYAVQVKRYSKAVSRRAVSDAVAGQQHYNCNAAMVVTNNYFTSGARSLSQSTNCFLVDRNMLARWIHNYKHKTPTYHEC